MLLIMAKLSAILMSDCVKTVSHLGVSALTGKGVKGDNDSTVKEHHLCCNHSSGFDNFSIRSYVNVESLYQQRPPSFE